MLLEWGDGEAVDEDSDVDVLVDIEEDNEVGVLDAKGNEAMKIVEVSVRVSIVICDEHSKVGTVDIEPIIANDCETRYPEVDEETSPVFGAEIDRGMEVIAGHTN